MTPRPLPITGTRDRYCVAHARRLRGDATCPLCPRAPMDAAVVSSGRRPKRDGSHAEEALYAALIRRGYVDFGRAYLTDGINCDPHLLFVRGYAWGLHLEPRRRFQSDAAFPSMRLLIEVEGVAHKIGHQQKHDVVRRQLAEAAGWRVLSVLPEQVATGEAVQLIAAALAARNKEVP